MKYRKDYIQKKGKTNMVDDSFAKDLKELSKQEDTPNLSINELKSIVISKVEDLTELYPNRTKPLAIKTILNNATKLYSKNKATKEDLYFVIDELEKEITKKNNLNEKVKKEALQEVDRIRRRKASPFIPH